MANLHALTVERHGRKYWRHATGYRFAAAESVVVLVLTELPMAAVAMPIAFVREGDAFIPVAVMGLEPGNNVFVAQDWSWLGHYIPATFRSYPFRLAKMEDGKSVIAVDEDFDLISDVPGGERFFNDDKQPSEVVAGMISFLSQFVQSQGVTEQACRELAKHNLIKPWQITVTRNSDEQRVEGLFQIDEAALNGLSAEALKEVQQSGGLAVAYCQIISMQHLSLLGQLTDMQKTASDRELSLQHLAPGGDLDLEFFNEGGTFNFSKL